jgi:predicted TIM-barrel fold metal-dependent hydrolase
VALRGWHVQLYVRGAELAQLAPRIAALPCPVVIDHMGQPELKAGVDQPGFRALLELVVAGHAWVKLSGAYRIDPSVGHAAAAPFARALINAAPDRCLWGTDWPHTRCELDPPDDGQLLDQLADWAPEDALWRAILVDNPARLYGFA